VECGVFRGSSLIAMALYLKQRRVAKRIFGLDSFQGFDEDVHKDLQLGGADNTEKRLRGFDQTSVSHVYSKLNRFNVTDSVTLIPGHFSDTLNILPDSHFSFVHLDCDIYASYKQTLEYFYYRMSPGGIILLDEYNDPPWPGCNIAVDEFLVGKPEKLSLIAMDNHEKYFITKQAAGKHGIQ
jgi:O-methyltransferase